MVRRSMGLSRGLRCFSRGSEGVKTGKREDGKTRVIFTFEVESVAALEKLQEDGRYDSLADTVKDSLQILWVLQREAKKGYTELIVRNPETDDEKVVLDYEANGNHKRI